MTARQFILIALATLGRFGLGAEPSDATTQAIVLQRETLREHGITQFMSIANSKEWKAPAIWSNWRMSRSSDVLEKRSAAIALEFGNELLAQIPDLAVSKSKLPVRDQLEERATALMTFANWIADGQAYGNAILARRGFELALVPVSQLAIDPGTPPAALERLQALITPSWCELAYRAGLLDHEAGTRMFASAKSDSELAAMWGEGVTRSLEAEYPNLEAEAGRLLPPELADARKRISLPLDSSQVPFFADQELRANSTTTEILNGKHHQLVANARLKPPDAADVRSLILFRVDIGKLPDAAVPGSFYTGMKGAFDDAWRSFAKANPNARGADNPKLGLTAWYAFDAITERIRKGGGNQ